MRGSGLRDFVRGMSLVVDILHASEGFVRFNFSGVNFFVVNISLLYSDRHLFAAKVSITDMSSASTSIPLIFSYSS